MFNNDVILTDADKNILANSISFVKMHSKGCYEEFREIALNVKSLNEKHLKIMYPDETVILFFETFDKMNKMLSKFIKGFSNFEFFDHKNQKIYFKYNRNYNNDNSGHDHVMISIDYKELYSFAHKAT